MSEATIVSVRKTGQIWPPAAHHDLMPHCRTSHDNSFHGDHIGEWWLLSVIYVRGQVGWRAKDIVGHLSVRREGEKSESLSE